MKNIILFLSILTFSLCTHGQTIHFAHVTDTHVGSQTGAADLASTVEDINRQKDIDFVLVTGDVTEFGSGEELREAKTILDKLNWRYYVVPGNHDAKWSESGCNNFVKIFGSEKFSFESGGILFIGTASGPNMRMAPGMVPKEQVVFLDSIIARRKSSGQPVIFVNHYPLDESLANWDKIIDLLKKSNVQATLLGHGHTNNLYNFEGIPGIMGRANLQTAKVEAGYNLVTIGKDTMYYAERLSSGRTLPVWCKIPLQERLHGNDFVFDSLAYLRSHPRPDYSLNQKYPGVKPLWSIQEKSDIGTGLSVGRNLAIYANTAGEIVAADIRSGRKIWTFHTGGKIFSTPAISGDKVICASTDQNIYCLNIQSGGLLWLHPTLKPIVASPAVENNRVYIGSSEGTFRCIDLLSGNLIWRNDSIKNFVECKPLLLKNSVCFGSWGDTFYALDKESGRLKWKREKYSNRMLSPAAVWPVSANGKIFLAAPDRHMTALDEQTGNEIWDSGTYTCRESIGISSDGNLVYIKNMTEGKVDAFYTKPMEQKIAWECDANLGYEISPSPIVESGNFIFVPTASGVVVAIDKKTHSVAWKYKISNALINAIRPIGKRRLLVSVMDGEIVCLKFP